MDQEILKKLESIEGKIGAIENRLGRVEALSVATSQKIVTMNSSVVTPETSRNTPPVISIKNTFSPVTPPTDYMPEVLSSFESVVEAEVPKTQSTIILYSNILRVFAGFTAVLGFILPYLIGFKIASDFGYFVYSMVLTFIILSTAFYKGWRELIIIGFVGTLLHFISWHSLFYTPEKITIAVYALTVFYFIYLISTITSKFTLNRKSDELDLMMLAINPIWFFFELYFLLQSGGEMTFAIIAISMGVLYISLSLIFRLYRREEEMLTLFLGSISAGFFTISIPFMFDQNNVTIAWAVVSVFIALLGALAKNDGMRMTSLAIFSVAIIRFIGFDNFVGSEFLRSWFPVMNKAFFTYLILMFTGAIIVYLFGHLMEDEYKSNKKVIAVLWVVVGLLFVASIVGEVSRYFDRAKINLSYQIEDEVKLIGLQDQLNLLNQSITPDQITDPYIRVNADARYTAVSNQKKASIVFIIFASIIPIASYLYFKRPKRSIT